AARDLVEYGIAAASTSHTYFAVGWSHRMGRIVGATFHAERDFEPVFARSFASPLPDLAGDVVDAQSCISVAQEQMLAMQKHTPLAGAGVVVMAMLTPGSIVARPIFDLASGRMLRKFSAEGMARPLVPSPNALSLLGRDCDNSERQR